MPDARDFLIVMSSLPDPATAGEIADELVRAGLVACAQVIPGVHSVFHWAGKQEHADECLLLMKTASKRYSELEVRIKALHPYELPEILAIPLAAGLDNYLSWMEKNTDIH